MNDLFNEEEMSDIDSEGVDARIVQFLHVQRDKLMVALIEKRQSMVEFVRTYMPNQQQ